jgi:hypothetical protein
MQYQSQAKTEATYVTRPHALRKTTEFCLNKTPNQMQQSILKFIA